VPTVAEAGDDQQRDLQELDDARQPLTGAAIFQQQDACDQRKAREDDADHGNEAGAFDQQCWQELEQAIKAARNLQDGDNAKQQGHGDSRAWMEANCGNCGRFTQARPAWQAAKLLAERGVEMADVGIAEQSCGFGEVVLAQELTRASHAFALEQGVDGGAEFSLEGLSAPHVRPLVPRWHGSPTNIGT